MDQKTQEVLPPEIIEEPRVGASIPVGSRHDTGGTSGLDLAGAAVAVALLLIPLTMAALGGS